MGRRKNWGFVSKIPRFRPNQEIDLNAGSASLSTVLPIILRRLRTSDPTYAKHAATQ